MLIDKRIYIGINLNLVNLNQFKSGRLRLSGSQNMLRFGQTMLRFRAIRSGRSWTAGVSSKRTMLDRGEGGVQKVSFC